MAQVTQVRSSQVKGKEQRTVLAGLPRVDYMLLGAVGTLTLLGLMLVYSGSYDLAYITQEGNAAYYLMRQAVFLTIGVVLMLLLARSDYMSWRRWSVLLMGGALILLAVVLLFGSERYGAQRTLLQGSVQPSEIIKLITVLYIADWLASKGDRLHDWGYGLVHGHDLAATRLRHGDRDRGDGGRDAVHGRHRLEADAARADCRPRGDLYHDVDLPAHA
jgi:cell division protein FtsW (lipid II flippase)